MEWMDWILEETVREVPQLALLLVAFAFTVGALMLLFMAFEYVYRRMNNGNEILNTIFRNNVTDLDRMVDDIEAMERLQLEHEMSRSSRRNDTEDDEFHRLHHDADLENRIARSKRAWHLRRQHLLRKQQLLRLSACLCLAIIIFWRMGALDSRWCSLSTTHHQLVHSLLAHTTAVLHAHGVEHWLDGATLVVVERDRELADWDDRLVIGTWRENKPKLWRHGLRQALEKRGRFYLEKYHATALVPVTNPPAFRLHYASLQRHFNKLPYLDIYIYARDGEENTVIDDDDDDVDEADASTKGRPSSSTATPAHPLRRVKASAVTPLRNATLTPGGTAAAYIVPLPHDPSAFPATRGPKEGVEATEEAARNEHNVRGYKSLTCALYRDRGNYLGLLVLGGTFIYFGLVIYALPRVSYNERWRF